MGTNSSVRVAAGEEYPGPGETTRRQSQATREYADSLAGQSGLRSTERHTAMSAVIVYQAGEKGGDARIARASGSLRHSPGARRRST